MRKVSVTCGFTPVAYDWIISSFFPCLIHVYSIALGEAGEAYKCACERVSMNNKFKRVTCEKTLPEVRFCFQLLSGYTKGNQIEKEGNKRTKWKRGKNEYMNLLMLWVLLYALLFVFIFLNELGRRDDIFQNIFVNLARRQGNKYDNGQIYLSTVKHFRAGTIHLLWLLLNNKSRDNQTHLRQRCVPLNLKRTKRSSMRRNCVGRYIFSLSVRWSASKVSKLS